MSTNDTDAAGIPPEDAPELPELSTERIDELEEALFAGIARDRLSATAEERRAAARHRRRRRGWLIGAGAAAALVVVVALAPSLARLGGAGSLQGSSVGDQPSGGGAVAPDAPLAPAPGTGGGSGDAASGSDGDPAAQNAGRDIVATASATVRVDDVGRAATAIGDAAQRRGGYVESMNIGSSGAGSTGAGSGEGRDPGIDDLTYPVPPGGGTGAWITVRVPADQLTAAIDDLSQVGTVEASSISRQDVTRQAIDLQARVDALQASVDRLTELMAQTGTVADLISAEGALSQRQADLESYEQQLKTLQDQVAMSSLTVSLEPRVESVEANPAGFGDGLATGWSGLVATLNGLVVAIGFLLPWLAVAVVAGLIVWGVIRVVRRRRTPPPSTAEQKAE